MAAGLELLTGEGGDGGIMRHPRNSNKGYEVGDGYGSEFRRSRHRGGIDTFVTGLSDPALAGDEVGTSPVAAGDGIGEYARGDEVGTSPIGSVALSADELAGLHLYLADGGAESRAAA